MNALFPWISSIKIVEDNAKTHGATQHQHTTATFGMHIFASRRRIRQRPSLDTISTDHPPRPLPPPLSARLSGSRWDSCANAPAGADTKLKSPCRSRGDESDDECSQDHPEMSCLECDTTHPKYAKQKGRRSSFQKCSSWPNPKEYNMAHSLNSRDNVKGIVSLETMQRKAIPFNQNSATRGGVMRSSSLQHLLRQESNKSSAFGGNRDSFKRDHMAALQTALNTLKFMDSSQHLED